MQTFFTAEQKADPSVAASQEIIRKCVRCGFCTATCPTYVLLGNELDSPRGRIYLIKDMLENERKPTAEVVKHIDRCLSCLSCMTACPSGVNYMHLVDNARAYIEHNYKRPLFDRAVRGLLAWLLPSPARFRIALILAQLARPFEFLLPGPLKAMLRLAPRPAAPAPIPNGSINTKRGRVALLQGCVEPVLQPNIRAATIRLLNRVGYDVVMVKGETCCGALEQHLGHEESALAKARHNVDAWTAEVERHGLDAIVITAAGCGTTIKDYCFLLRTDPAYADKAARVSTLARDVTELLADADLRGDAQNIAVTYHGACSLQHGQKVNALPKQLLQKVGFTVTEAREGHLCCGSAGTYNILQPEIATQLRDRKLANIAATKPDLVATGNIGCATQLASGTDTPVIHTVELLDWATGGPKPAQLS
jgi:glycolate oxidase iron-sulfur subunit